MNQTAKHDSWKAGENYDQYMGRWSQLVAQEFLHWLEAPEDAEWADIGCGTGALTRTVLAKANPKSVVAIDPSDGFLTYARREITDPRVVFQIADAQDIPTPDDEFDVTASALVLNFIPDKLKALGEMRRTTRPGGIVSFYVWDYPGSGIGFIDTFWKAAASLDPTARDLDEANRFPFCTFNGLREICETAGLRNAVIGSLEIESEFPDFEAFWHPFTLGAGPAPGYCMSLPEASRERLRDLLKRTLGTDTVIRLPARAWAVKSIME
mgnify:CR=1 FL=1